MIRNYALKSVKKKCKKQQEKISYKRFFFQSVISCNLLTWKNTVFITANWCSNCQSTDLMHITCMHMHLILAAQNIHSVSGGGLVFCEKRREPSRSETVLLSAVFHPFTSSRAAPPSLFYRPSANHGARHLNSQPDGRMWRGFPSACEAASSSVQCGKSSENILWRCFHTSMSKSQSKYHEWMGTSMRP